MKLFFYCVLLLVACVFGSKLDNVQDHQETEAKIEEPEIDSEDPKFIKQSFIFSIKHGDIAQVKAYAEKYSYLTNKFNRDIFMELIKCFGLQAKDKTCWDIYDILKPSFLVVSHSTSSPLILAIRYNKMELLKALYEVEGIEKVVNKIDEFKRTALMYAAKRGSYFAVRIILLKYAEAESKAKETKTESESIAELKPINFKDSLGKTAIHYACEMKALDKNQRPDIEFHSYLTGAIDNDVENKESIVALLMAYGGSIDPEGVAYKLTSADYELKKLIMDFGGKVVIEDKPEAIVKYFGTGMALAQVLKQLNMSGYLKTINVNLIKLIMANPLMSLLNELCYHFMQYFLPGIDANVNLSFDMGDEIQDFSFNLLFVILMIPVFKYLMQIYMKQNFKF